MSTSSKLLVRSLPANFCRFESRLNEGEVFFHAKKKEIDFIGSCPNANYGHATIKARVHPISWS